MDLLGCRHFGRWLFDLLVFSENENNHGHRRIET